MRLNDNNTFIGINPPYQLSVIHSSKLIYPRETLPAGRGAQAGGADCKGFQRVHR